jgi:hypothetical protein
MTVEEGKEETAQERTARQQAEKDQLEKAQKEKDPKPAGYPETDKEQAQERGDAKERKSAEPSDTLRSPPDGAR